MAEHAPIGIDLGTTHSLIAVFEPEGPRVLANEMGHELIPSAVALDDTGHLVIGDPARIRRRRGLNDTAARFKSDMGTPKEIGLGDRKLNPTSLSALILRELKQHARAALGFDVERAVISVPAWFGEAQRRATVEAAHLAGLEVQRLVNEPTAAALAYGLGVGDDPIDVAVVDLGGGTFDITILEIFEGVADVRASSGDTQLGGEDATDALLAWAAEQAGVAALGGGSGPERAAAERAKKRLSTELVAEFEAFGSLHRIDRPTFAGITRFMRERMASGMRKAAVQSGVKPSSLDTVVLVGGASRMPWMADLVREVFAIDPEPAADVDRVVALGAAIQAGLVTNHKALRDRLVTDVLTHSLGVSTRKSWGETELLDRFDPVLHRGSTLPTSGTGFYTTLRHDQTSVTFPIYEGENRTASRNHLLGQLTLDDLPVHEDEDVREGIRVRFTHDASGLLEVEAKLESTGVTVSAVIERGGIQLSEEERAEAARALEAFRTHARDLLPNRWLLERANRVVELMTGVRREQLDHVLTGFELALESGLQERIDAHRTALRKGLEVALADTGLSWEDL